MIQCKRVYDAVSAEDGQRVLVDRLWPRGLSKHRLHLDDWLPAVGPSTALRRQFGHDSTAFDAFRMQYRAELARHPEHWQNLLARARQGTLTLLYAARDVQLNNAQVLAEFLEDELDRGGELSSPVCYAERF